MISAYVQNFKKMIQMNLFPILNHQSHIFPSTSFTTSHLQWIQHAFPSDNDLLGLLLHGQRSD